MVGVPQATEHLLIVAPAGTLDANRIEGAAKQVKGSIRQAVGKITGDRATQMHGAAEKLTGKVQSKVGAAADTLRHKLKK
jgi:uncharacterized protein YjbJ (UPF0337 family)